MAIDGQPTAVAATVKKRKPSPREQRAGALIGGLIIGAGGGALIGGEMSGSAWAGIGAAIGGPLFGVSELLTMMTRPKGEPKAAWHRIAGAVLFGAMLGAIIGLVFDDPNLIVFGTVIGLVTGLVGLVGLLSFRLNRLALGAVCGAGAGIVAEAVADAPDVAILGAATVLAYRLIGAPLFRGSRHAKLVGEGVRPEDVRFVVPFEAQSKRVGVDYFKDLARTADGSFKRNAPGIGIVESLDCLGGPTFDLSKVDPLVREFYEHTTRFKLSIVPSWRFWMRPVYRGVKNLIARRIGQANLPMDVEEAQRGVVSYIDTVEFEGDQIIDLRGWVRAFKESGEAIYVGIYTTFRQDDEGYVSVGFPLPGANFTVTLFPFNNRGGGLLLKSHGTGRDFTGHYLTAIDPDGSLTVIEVPSLSEEIDVYVKDGELFTDHRFYVSGRRFLTLYYTIERADEG